MLPFVFQKWDSLAGKKHCPNYLLIMYHMRFNHNNLTHFPHKTGICNHLCFIKPPGLPYPDITEYHRVVENTKYLNWSSVPGWICKIKMTEMMFVNSLWHAEISLPLCLHFPTSFPLVCFPNPSYYVFKLYRNSFYSSFLQVTHSPLIPKVSPSSTNKHTHCIKVHKYSSKLPVT